jgi:hypothetical protein
LIKFSILFLDLILLLRYLKIYDFDDEKAYDLLVTNLEMRKKFPQIFENRDLSSNEIQQALHTFHLFDLPQKTTENHKISIFRLADSDPDKFVFLEIVRMASSTLDGRFVRCDEGEMIDGDFMVFDMQGFTFKHLYKCVANLSLMNSYMKYSQEAVPLKMMGNHFINCSPIFSKLMGMIKPFMNKEVKESLHFHTSMDTLYEKLPRELLPEELGGSAGTINDIFKDWLKKLMIKR